MAIRKDIVWTVGADGSVSPTVPQYGGVQGEHNATQVVFHVGENSVWDNPNFKLYIECDDSAGNVDTTDRLQVERGRVSVSLPLAWTQYGGMDTLRLVAEEEDGTIAYTAEGCVYFDSRQNASKKVDGLLKGRMAEMEQRANDALSGAETAKETALTYVQNCYQHATGAQLNAETAKSAAKAAADAAEKAKKASAGKLDVLETDEYAYAFCDPNGYVGLAMDKSGKLLCKSDAAIEKSMLEKIIHAMGGKLDVLETDEYAYALCDPNGYVVVAIDHNGEKEGFGGGESVGGIASIYKGKRLSIYGDSISTFTGYIPAGNRVFYTGSNCGVGSVDETWWMQVLRSLDMELCVNNSWSGRCVSNIRDTESGNLNSGGYALANVQQLSTRGVDPDVIIVKLGVNDFRRSTSCPLGTYNGTQDFPTEPTSFREAYAIMLKNILQTYPNAEVWCCTMMENETANDGHFPQLDAAGRTLNDWNEAIRELAALFSVNVLDHASCGITYWNLSQYMGDYSSTTGVALHPNAAGHALMANQTIRQMSSKVIIVDDGDGGDPPTVVVDTSIDFYKCGLPVLALTGDTTGMTKEDAVDLTYTITTVRGTKIKSGTCSCKWQGSSSVRRGYLKRNYTIKFDTAFEATSAISSKSGGTTPTPWGEQKKYCLKANWIDPSAARNVVCAKLWGEIVATRDGVHEKLAASPNKGAIDGFPVVILIKGEFEGLYTFNIPKDGWMFNMGDGNAEYVVCGESNSMSACGFYAEATFIEGDSQADTDFAIEYQPDGVEDATVVTSFNNAIRAVMNAPDSAEWESAVAPYFDIDSAIDYYIFNCCISGVDNTRKNILYGTYDGVKWFMSAYDLDATLGSNAYGSGLTQVKTSKTQFYEAATGSGKHRLFELIYKYSKDKLKARYAELRTGILSDANVWYVFNNFVAPISRAVYNADAEKWADKVDNTDKLPMPGTTTASVENFMLYYRMHCALLDKEMED